MTPANLRPQVKALIGLCGTFLSVGILINWNGAWTVQSFVIRPRCALSGNDTNCCPTCLGLSTVEWGLYLAIPAIIAVGTVVFSGLIIDVFGLSAAAVFFALFGTFGAVLRAVATHFASNHAVLLIFFILGECMIVAANFGISACRDYIVVRYFEPRLRPLVVGLMFGLVGILFVAIGFLLPRLASTTGVYIVYWILAAYMSFSIIAAFGLLAIFSLSSQVKEMENEICDERLAGAIHRQSPKSVLSNVRKFHPGYWFIFFAFGTAHSVFLSFSSNAPLYQMSIHNVSSTEAGLNLAWGYVGFSFVSCVVGGLLWFTSHLLEVAVIMWILTVIGYSLMFAFPFLSMLLGFGSYSVIIACLKSTFGCYVPVKSLGLASGLILAFTLINFSICSNIVGAIMHVYDRWDGAHYSLIFLLSIMTAAGFCPLLLRCIYGNFYTIERSEHSNSQKRHVGETEADVNQAMLVEMTPIDS